MVERAAVNRKVPGSRPGLPASSEGVRFGHVGPHVPLRSGPFDYWTGHLPFKENGEGSNPSRAMRVPANAQRQITGSEETTQGNHTDGEGWATDPNWWHPLQGSSIGRSLGSDPRC